MPAAKPRRWSWSRTRLGQLVFALEGRESRVDQRRCDATGAELGAEAGGPVAARGARRHPVAGERRVVHVAAAGQVGHDLGRDVLRGAATHEAASELARGEGTAGEEVRRREARGPGVEDLASRAYRLKKELAPGVAATFSSFFCSKDASLAEKMPRTLRSKSSALVAASRAVSYEIMPSR